MKSKNYYKILLILVFSLFICSTVFVKDTTSMKVNVLEKKVKKRPKSEVPFSDKRLGSFVEDGRTYFRLFSPTAAKVKLVIFKKPEEAYGNEIEMERDENGVWEVSLEGERYGLFYGFRIRNLKMPGIESIICLDPYAKAVTTYNTYLNPRRAIVVKEDDYDWEGDTWIQMDWRDLIIYEMHVRDMTEHPSSGAEQRGTYRGLIEKDKAGGIDYIKNLGVNAVELLPAQEFANIEIPFGDSINGKYNTWNPYERNHWGYMTAAYFAPEAYYSEDVRKIEFYKWTGKKAKAVTDFKDMVKAFHKEGIAVIMDVVYNHISEYELGNLKEIDKEYYFRLDRKGNYIAQSYCGNDFKTENPMVRRLIIDSIIYWMKEYHVDGFRFDLGKLIDWQTIEEIIREAQKINPNVVFVCEPWGGGYDPGGFSIRGWGSWNDHIRNGIKGENPFDGRGWIFGNWYGNNDPYRIRSYVNGTLTKDLHGLFLLPEHSVNYLESHDGYTLGDFIRLGLGDARKDEVIENIDEHVRLTETQLKLNKLAALYLLTTRGIIMLSEGQEFARSKIIPQNANTFDPHRGMIDHNSYEKDNETNYLNYNHANINSNLLEYYKGLIQFRKHFEAFRRAEHSQIKFFNITDNPFSIGYLLEFNNDSFIVLCNANMNKTEEILLPQGEWDILVNSDRAGIESLGRISSKIILETSTGVILKKVNE
jgi:pullulanase/glycogen debranching enzyme